MRLRRDHIAEKVLRKAGKQERNEEADL